MNQALVRLNERPVQQQQSVFATCEVSLHDPQAASTLLTAFAGMSLAHVLVFSSPHAGFSDLMAALSQALTCDVIGCTSAGEISGNGYLDDHIVAVGLPSSHFSARTVLIENLTDADPDFDKTIDRLIQTRIALQEANQDKPNGFSFLMVDGMSRREDQLVNAIAPAFSGFPLFGGSAGDGLRFEEAFVSHKGQVYRNAATLTYVATSFEAKAFSINHMVATDRRMVVTAADPSSRVVKEINAEPAAQEYARLVGKDSEQLDELVFAAHPVTVRIGDAYHVRAIQRVNEDGDLVFFSAIDEGMVLTVAEPQDMADHLDEELARLVDGRTAPMILGCDCVFRRIEAQKNQSRHRVNRILQKYGIVGFSTYGEQIGPLHVNHTMTGVALFPPRSGEHR